MLLLDWYEADMIEDGDDAKVQISVDHKAAVVLLPKFRPVVGDTFTIFSLQDLPDYLILLHKEVKGFLPVPHQLYLQLVEFAHAESPYALLGATIEVLNVGDSGVPIVCRIVKVET
jgi:hypothetical protein